MRSPSRHLVSCRVPSRTQHSWLCKVGLCQPDQATCTMGMSMRFRLDIQEFVWRRCARVGRYSSLIFLEVTLAEAIHGFILWDKHYIILKPPTDPTSRLTSLQPSQRAPSMSQPSLRAASKHSSSPSSIGLALNTPASPLSPGSPPPPPAKKQKHHPRKQAYVKEPPKK